LPDGKLQQVLREQRRAGGEQGRERDQPFQDAVTPCSLTHCSLPWIDATADHVIRSLSGGFNIGGESGMTSRANARSDCRASAPHLPIDRDRTYLNGI
jgi:hypothetical protein